MERRARFRIGVFILAILTIISLFTFRLYKLQTSTDEATIREADALTYWTTVKASRGEILDRNGAVLVTNRASYNVVMINFVLFSNSNLNETLLTLLNLCEDLGIEPVTTFPVSATRPYTYTLEESSAANRDYFRRFLRSRSWDTDISAQTLMNNLCDAYNIPEDWSDEDVYRVVSVRYELSLRNVDNMPLDNYTLAKDVSAESLAAIMELGIPGVIVETTTVRDYKTPYAAHILGYTGAMEQDEYEEIYEPLGYSMDAAVGREGVELAFEEYLHGTDGLKETTITADGEVLNETYLSVPQPGSNVELTIDINLQTTAEQALEQVILDLRENGAGSRKEGKDAEGGAVVAIDVNTGEILACASYPTFDLSTFRNAEVYSSLLEDPYKPLFNRALLGLYAPGSIYKMVTAIAGVDYANWGRYREVTDEGQYMKYQEYGYTPACYIYTSSGITHGTVNMMQAISVSCNYYFYELGLTVATTDVDYVAQKMGLGEPTGIELFENTGTRANADTKHTTYYGTDQAAWNEGDKLQASIGQSLNAFTPLQMANYAATLANDGTRYSTTILRRVVSWDYQDLLLENTPEIASELEISEEALLAYHEGMEMAANNYDGTAQAYMSDLPVTVAAKTGTAQHGSGGSDNASFICFAPAEDPQIAIAVYVEKGAQGGNLGRVARAILEAYFSQESKYETTNGENTLN